MSVVSSTNTPPSDHYKPAAHITIARAGQTAIELLEKNPRIMIL